MANEFLDLFEQLFYSTEVWGFIGIAGIIAFFFLVTYKVKYVFPFFVLILAFMGVQYVGMVAETAFYIWHFIFLIVGALFLMVFGVERFYHKK